MFVPRQVQKTYTVGHPAPLPKSTASCKAGVISSTAPQPKKQGGGGTIDQPAAKAIVLVLEQVFSSKNPYNTWFEERRREVDGHDDYIHLAAVIECPYLAEHKPQLSQILVRRALKAVPSEMLETSTDGYHIRLVSSVKRTALLESHTVYIEPSATNATRTPGRLALELQKTLPAELLPVKWTSNDNRSWSLLTLSSAVTDAHLSKASLWPAGWIVLSQAEWKRRDAIYRQRRKEALQARQHASYIPTVATAEPKPKPLTHTFEPGLIVHVTHLHPAVNKPAISSFIMRSVDRYVRKRGKKAKSIAESGVPEILTPHNHKVQINYIDYKKGGDSCYLRQSTKEDSELIVAALGKRRRAMCEGDDRKGRKAKEGYVQGRLLEGEEEAAYWRKVETTVSEMTKKGRKGGKKEKKEGDAKVATVDVRAPGKRPRLSSGTLSPGGGDAKRKRFGG